MMSTRLLQSIAGFGMATCILTTAMAQPPAEKDAPTSPPHWVSLRECGRLSLLTLGELRGYGWRYSDIVRHCGIDERGGSSVDDVSRAGEKLGQPLAAIRCSFDQVRKYTPLIAFQKSKGDRPAHFCVVASALEDQVLIVDPPHPPKWVWKSDFSDSWDGLVIVPADDLSSSPWVQRAKGLAAVIAGILLYHVVAFLRRMPARLGNRCNEAL